MLLLCVWLKLFRCRFVPLLEPNPASLAVARVPKVTPSKKILDPPMGWKGGCYRQGRQTPSDIDGRILARPLHRPCPARSDAKIASQFLLPCPNFPYSVQANGLDAGPTLKSFSSWLQANPLGLGLIVTSPSSFSGSVQQRVIFEQADLHCELKKQDTILLSLTSPNVNRFKILSPLDLLGNL